MIVVITQKYLASRYCTNEMYVANTDGKAIFPVFLQDVDFSVTKTARGVKYVIAGINWIMFKPDNDYKASLTKLIDGLKEKGIHNFVNNLITSNGTSALSVLVTISILLLYHL